ncbi:MAG TPA: hypothetical protein VFK72_05380 [Nevskia sp.]|nr:hypothetical protein [Nevskia sp.]
MSTDRLTAHGVFVEVEGLGVWLSGASGAGKSELGLELVSRGHRLVADDAIEFRIDAGNPAYLIGRCPPLLDGFIEVRGLGILNLRRLYGDASVLGEHRLDLAIALDARTEPSADERLTGRRSTVNVLGIAVPEISLPRRVGHNLAVLVEAACRDHRHRAAGYNACDDLVARQAQHLIAQAAAAANPAPAASATGSPVEPHQQD